MTCHSQRASPRPRKESQSSRNAVGLSCNKEIRNGSITFDIRASQVEDLRATRYKRNKLSEFLRKFRRLNMSRTKKGEGNLRALWLPPMGSRFKQKIEVDASHIGGQRQLRYASFICRLQALS